MREAMFYEKTGDNAVHCHLCAHHCRIAESEFGFCSVRQNINGQLFTMVYGKPVAQHIDPIEKKPLYHFLPGSMSYSLGAPGCNFHCGFCQNWQISQIPENGEGHFDIPMVPPESIVIAAKEYRCKSISYTYTEPTIFFEYAYDIARIAADEKIHNIFVTNGFMTRQALETIAPYLSAANVDLKSFREAYYRSTCKAHLKPVLDSIRRMKQLGIWVEVTTLIVPGENDSEDELKEIAGFIADTGPEIPWHISRFYPSYRFTDRLPTPEETLTRAREIGCQAGLHHVYIGNMPADNSTICRQCRQPVVRRGPSGGILSLHLDKNRCAACGAVVSGVWAQ